MHVGCILSGARLSRLARTSGYRIRPFILSCIILALLLILNDFENCPFFSTVKISWKKNRRFWKASKIKLAINWCNHWPQTDTKKNPVATNWRSDTACKKNLHWIMKDFKEAYKSIFHYYNEPGSHENSFYISTMHWIHCISN